jgi:integral membrane sensor domain MASE1
MKKSFAQLTTFLAAVFTSALAFAHEGHGASALQHDGEHMMWLVSAVVVISAVAVILYKKYQQC